jgi:hypothetical protein
MNLLGFMTYSSCLQRGEGFTQHQHRSAAADLAERTGPAMLPGGGVMSMVYHPHRAVWVCMQAQT